MIVETGVPGAERRRFWALLRLSGGDPPYVVAQWEPSLGQWVKVGGSVIDPSPDDIPWWVELED